MKAHQHYKTNFAKKVRQIQIYDKGALVYVRDDSPREDGNPTHKLRPKKTGTYLVVEATPETVTIERDRISDIVSTDKESIGRQKDGNNSPTDQIHKMNT